MTWTGLGERWPVRVVGDYVHNLGASTGRSGVSADLLVGRASAKGDWRFGHGHAETGIDAVFAAFSHDNMAIATVDLQHGISVDHGLSTASR